LSFLSGLLAFWKEQFMRNAWGNFFWLEIIYWMRQIVLDCF
jgi:hypothetical protein